MPRTPVVLAGRVSYKARMHATVVVFPGSNCDQDVFHVLKDVLGLEVDYVWHKETSLKGADAVVLHAANELLCGDADVRGQAQDGLPHPLQLLVSRSSLRLELPHAVLKISLLLDDRAQAHRGDPCYRCPSLHRRRCQLAY